ncbi:6705_t:CDS:2 [Paraglomus brasilianum]|uniref:6705_t:CDS:1 n=1 Tax=Paraglomus brasilianum TaxID=144538 RepID=A0A9N8Z845_9GLOM|nr:6705_t:CDS:2 [Paraglomus brasilianum]
MSRNKHHPLALPETEIFAYLAVDEAPYPTLFVNQPVVMDFPLKRLHPNLVHLRLYKNGLRHHEHYQKSGGRREFDESVSGIIQLCPTLKELILRGCNITDISTNGIINSCRNLRKLDIGFCEQISGNPTAAIKRANPKIKGLRLYSQILPGAMLQALLPLYAPVRGRVSGFANNNNL